MQTEFKKQNGAQRYQFTRQANIAMGTDLKIMSISPLIRPCPENIIQIDRTGTKNEKMDANNMLL